jgi:hypothetical protein
MILLSLAISYFIVSALLSFFTEGATVLAEKSVVLFSPPFPPAAAPIDDDILGNAYYASEGDACAVRVAVAVSVFSIFAVML